MGYGLTIGNAVLYFNAKSRECIPDVLKVTQVEAPDLEPGGKVNSFSPSYGYWHNAFLGRISDDALNKLWEDLSVYGQSSVVPITKDDHEVIKAVLQRWREKHPNKRGGFLDVPLDWWGNHSDDDAQKLMNEQGIDDALAVLEWLEFWFGWAIANCAYPVIEIS